MGDRLSDGAGRGAYLRMRAQWLANCAARNEPCYYCNRPLHYGLKHPDPLAVVVAHVLPVKTHPELEFDRTNWRPSCALGNRIGGPCDVDDAAALDTGVPSEAWMTE
ncbi:HNH endonuclease [Mycobacterium sp. OTB74]|uniref:HNH endonuclease n=1 Tax=Mycobacterium sp. OTB74 TaxID=1853452 RepID=UPI002474908C|nr:HNH endonuclease [Mycobacterium sp. OTB74]